MVKTNKNSYKESQTCSDKFMRTTLCPEYFPKAIIKLVLPTPGLPSSKTTKHAKNKVKHCKTPYGRIWKQCSSPFLLTWFSRMSIQKHLTVLQNIPGFGSCIARKTRKAFLRVVGVKNSKPPASHFS